MSSQELCVVAVVAVVVAAAAAVVARRQPPLLAAAAVPPVQQPSTIGSAAESGIVQINTKLQEVSLSVAFFSTKSNSTSKGAEEQLASLAHFPATNNQGTFFFSISKVYRHTVKISPAADPALRGP